MAAQVISRLIAKSICKKLLCFSVCKKDFLKEKLFLETYAKYFENYAHNFVKNSRTSYVFLSAVVVSSLKLAGNSNIVNSFLKKIAL